MKHYCVISHTHWDREWYQTREEFLLRLVDLIDHLLEILERESDYVFHMDAQTIVFEDYFEVRSEKRELCEKFIREGRMLVGPWYVQNDFYLTSGESTVRNLLLGIKQANDLGACAKTGHAPDQFGLVSQLPQILSGFNIDHCVFARGYTLVEIDQNGQAQTVKRPSEINWQSPDGSSVLGLHMPKFYNNAQRFSSDIDKAEHLLNLAKEGLSGYATTDYLLLMNGVDHLEPQGDLLPILEKLNKRLPKGEKIYQTTLQEYARLVKEAKPTKDMPTVVGELKQGANMSLLKDTASSRIYLKQKNCQLQNLLSYKIEPLYAALRAKGMSSLYPAGQLNYLWKTLLKNHAHDSICGCSRDAVHKRVESRFERVQNMGEELLRRGMSQLCAHCTSDFSQDDYQIAVFNPLSQERSEVVRVTLDILAKDEPETLKITAPDKSEVDFAVISRTELEKSVFSPVNLPGRFLTVRYELLLLAKNIAPLGYKIYKVEINKNHTNILSNDIASLRDGRFLLENDCLKVCAHKDGKIDIVNKQSGKVYSNVLSIFDTADAGDSYVYRPIENDIPIDLSAQSPEITFENIGALEGVITLHYDLSLPAFLDRKTMKRSEKTVRMPLDICLKLSALSPYVEVNVNFDNTACDHKLCAAIDTGLVTDISVASSPFDMVSRDKNAIDTRICNLTEHTSGAILLSDGENSVSILTRGLYAYEHLQDKDGTLIIPLVRCNGVISSGLLSGDDTWRAEGNQCLGKRSCSLAIMPSDSQRAIERAAQYQRIFQVPMVTQGEAVDVRKFTGGRPGVQNSAVAELFYQPLPYADTVLPRENCLVKFSCSDVVLTAFKESFDRTGLILRFVNMSDKPQKTSVDLSEISPKEVCKTNLAETEREPLLLQNGVATLGMRQKEIVTLYIKEK